MKPFVSFRSAGETSSAKEAVFADGTWNWASILPEDERNLWRGGIRFCNIRYWTDDWPPTWAEQGETADQV